MTELLSRPDELESEIDEQLVCTDVVAITHDVTSFVLRSPLGRQFAFQAGQYVTVGATVDSVPVERCYTISSPPSRPDDLTITVKRVPDGPMSNWLHDRFRPGDRLRVSGPLGRFVLDERPAKYLFLSAGSGITPLMSMTRTLRDDPSADIVFVHSARSPRDIVFRAELNDLAASHPGIRVNSVCEDDAVDERWLGPRGRLTPSLLDAVAPDLLDRDVFTCGPAPYMDAVRSMLASAGADPARCHEESFVLGGTSIPALASTGVGCSVEFRRSGRTVDCAPGESVLAAALRAGLPVPSSCGEGMCGTCKTTMLSGEVDLQHNGGIRPREIAQGKILLCCSVPLADLILDA